MSFVCSICDRDPKSHSFVHICQENNIHLFYCCPAIATRYQDTEGILEHFDDTLNHFQCQSRPWKWIFDAHNFSIAHLLEFSTAIGIAKLISEKYSEYLLGIHIVNANWAIRVGMNMVLPLLPERVQRITRIVEIPENMQPHEDGTNLFAQGLLSRHTSMEFSKVI
jgi:hypothetical protein